MLDGRFDPEMARLFLPGGQDSVPETPGNGHMPGREVQALPGLIWRAALRRLVSRG